MLEESHGLLIQPKLAVRNISNENGEIYNEQSKNNEENNYISEVNIPSEGNNNETEENIDKKEALLAINNYNKEHKKDHKGKEDHNNICTNIKDIDWLSDIFINKDIKNMLIQNNHIKEILVNEAIYYLYIFSKIFVTWSREKETEKLLKEEEKEREKQKSKYHINLPPIDMKKISKKVIIPKIKVGIIGCGNIGKELLKTLIKIKDRNIFNFNIMVSTRQPDKLQSEFLEVLDEDIHIMLNNEKIFDECEIIYLCIQPSQLDLLVKEIKTNINERIEKLTKKEYKCFPLIVSFLSATPLQRLELYFPKKVHLERTMLLHNFLRAKKKSLFGKTLNEEGEYIEESSEHLLAKEKCIDFIENLIKNLTIQFYSEAIIQQKKNNDQKIKKAIEKEIKESPLFLFEVIFGKENAQYYYDIYNFTENGKFCIPGMKETIEKLKEEKNKDFNNIHFKLSGKKILYNEEDKKVEENEELETNPEIIQVKQQFTKKISSDFKFTYINYLNSIIKTK